MSGTPHHAKTIVDIAEDLGLSKTTVADALRGTGRVAPATREKVRRLAEAAGYRANKSARQLRTKASETVGLYIGADVRNMPFYMPFTFGAMEDAAAHGLDITLVTHVGAGSGPAAQLAGAVVIDALPEDPILQGIVRAGIPIVSAGRLSAAQTPTAAVIEIDYAKTITSALDIMESMGARCPALVAPAERDPASWSELIAAAYDDWCHEHGVSGAVFRVPVYASNEDISAMLDTALAAGNLDGFLFSWQDLADRAEIILAHREPANRKAFRTGTLVDTYVESAHYPYDLLIDLDARGFGAQAMRCLRHLLDKSEAPPIHNQHAARIIEVSGV